MATVPATWESLPPGPKWAMRQKGLVVTGRVSFLCVQGSLSVGGGRGNQVARGLLCHLITCEARRCHHSALNQRSQYQSSSGSVKVTQQEVKAQSVQTRLASGPGSIFNHPLPATTQFYFMLKKGTQGTAELCLVQE